MSKGGCSDVQRAVKGLRESQQFHHVEAFGLIDRDDRDEEEVNQLAEGGVFALDMCSVESLYYCSDSIAAVARRQAESLGRNADKQQTESLENNADKRQAESSGNNASKMIELAEQEILRALQQGDLAQRMAARRCERRVRDAILRQIPNWKCIKAKSEFDISVDSPYQDELDHFNELVNEKRLDDLIARYPLRESGAFEAIPEALELRSKKTYEQMLVTRIRDDEDLVESLKKRVGPLSKALGS